VPHECVSRYRWTDRTLGATAGPTRPDAPFPTVVSV
jgi:hypothetical protein